MDLQFKGKYILCGEIACVTGLHIGGSTEGIEIGGVDNPVLKDPLTEMPYIPGSSLKGKIRSLLEWQWGQIKPHTRHSREGKASYAAYACDELRKKRDECATPAEQQEWDRAFALARLFGPASDDAKVRETAGPTCLTVRDAFPTEATIEQWKEWLGEGIYTEIKTENTIDRVTSEATPRPMERVPAGSAFTFEMVFDVYRDEDSDLFRDLFTAMHLLENSALGGSGSRGHGQVRFQGLQMEWRSLDYYRNGGQSQSVELPATDVAAVKQKFSEIQWPHRTSQ